MYGTHGYWSADEGWACNKGDATEYVVIYEKISGSLYSPSRSWMIIWF